MLTPLPGPPKPYRPLKIHYQRVAGVFRPDWLPERCLYFVSKSVADEPAGAMESLLLWVYRGGPAYADRP